MARDYVVHGIVDEAACYVAFLRCLFSTTVSSLPRKVNKASTKESMFISRKMTEDNITHTHTETLESRERERERHPRTCREINSGDKSGLATADLHLQWH